MMKRKSMTIVLILAALLAACAPTGGEPEAAPEETATVEVMPVPEEPTAAPTEPATTPNVGGAELSPGEVPPALFEAVVADALARSGGERGAIIVQKSEEVQWPDGSLGCPQPDMMYTQAIVPGYQVILEIGGQTFDYHLASTDYFFLCESGGPVMPGTATP